jgi:hypothetical protein
MGGRVGLLGELEASLALRGGRVGLLGELEASLALRGGRVGLLAGAELAQNALAFSQEAPR